MNSDSLVVIVTTLSSSGSGKSMCKHGCSCDHPGEGQVGIF